MTKVYVLLREEFDYPHNNYIVGVYVNRELAEAAKKEYEAEIDSEYDEDDDDYGCHDTFEIQEEELITSL